METVQQIYSEIEVLNFLRVSQARHSHYDEEIREHLCGGDKNQAPNDLPNQDQEPIKIY